MTVCVDSMRVRAKIGGHDARWSHLTADTVEELYTFAEKLFLKREWFQKCCKSDPRCPKVDAPAGICIHFHYDVTDRVRSVALREGAESVSLSRMGTIMSARRTIVRSGNAAALLK